MHSSRSRQRDILPLPRNEAGCIAPDTRLSRCVRRRLLRKGHVNTWKQQAIDPINELSGGQVLDRQSLPSFGLGTSRALLHIDESSRSSKLDATVLREGSLSELLAKSGIYDSSATVLLYSKHLVSWPDVGSRPSSLLGGLPGTEFDMLSNWPSHLLTPESTPPSCNTSDNPIVPYCDKS
jgi:hypothetical protein